VGIVGFAGACTQGASAAHAAAASAAGTAPCSTLAVPCHASCREDDIEDIHKVRAQCLPVHPTLLLLALPENTYTHSCSLTPSVPLLPCPPPCLVRARAGNHDACGVPVQEHHRVPRLAAQAAQHRAHDCDGAHGLLSGRPGEGLLLLGVLASKLLLLLNRVQVQDLQGPLNCTAACLLLLALAQTRLPAVCKWLPLGVSQACTSHLRTMWGARTKPHKPHTRTPGRPNLPHPLTGLFGGPEVQRCKRMRGDNARYIGQANMGQATAGCSFKFTVKHCALRPLTCPAHHPPARTPPGAARPFGRGLRGLHPARGAGGARIPARREPHPPRHQGRQHPAGAHRCVGGLC